MASIWPVAAINKIKSKRKDLIKENDIKSSIKSRKNANIHFFIYIKRNSFFFWDQGLTKDQSTLLHVSRRVTCKEQVCGKSTHVHLTITNTQLRVENVLARGRRAPFESLWRSREEALACTAGFLLRRLWWSHRWQKPPLCPLPSSIMGTDCLGILSFSENHNIAQP